MIHPRPPVTELVLVRHGESTGNVAHARAYADGAEVIDIPERDPDVPLSELGRQQAAELGARMTGAPPDAVWCSPYLRAQETARIALDAAGLDVVPRIDERLRDRELGVLDLLTGRGIRARYPEEAERRRRWGKFYYRAPGGESWADVALRLRSLLHEVEATSSGRVVLVCHDAVVLLIRYILEPLDERTVLGISASTAVANASVTRMVPVRDQWHCVDFNDTAHLEPDQETEHPGRTDALPS